MCSKSAILLVGVNALLVLGCARPPGGQVQRELPAPPQVVQPQSAPEAPQVTALQSVPPVAPVATGRETSKKALDSTTPEVPRSEWVNPGGRIWAGVKLYYGPNHAYVGEILGGNDKYVDPLAGKHFRGVRVRYPNGHTEWKDRDAVIRDDRWCVRRDDPAIEKMEWYVYEF